MLSTATALPPQSNNQQSQRPVGFAFIMCCSINPTGHWRIVKGGESQKGINTVSCDRCINLTAYQLGFSRSTGKVVTNGSADAYFASIGEAVPDDWINVSDILGGRATPLELYEYVFNNPDLPLSVEEALRDVYLDAKNQNLVRMGKPKESQKDNPLYFMPRDVSFDPATGEISVARHIGDEKQQRFHSNSSPQRIDFGDVRENPAPLFVYLATEGKNLPESQRVALWDELARANPVKLNLHHKNLGDIPSELSRLVRLQELRLSRNNLTTMPDISSLQNLEVLDLGVNNLKEIPPSVFELRQLVDLDCTMNQMEALPERIGELGRLKNLSVAGNNIKAIPQSIKKLGRLQFLLFADNSIEEFPPELWQLSNLVSFDIGGNPLKEIPPPTKPNPWTRMTNASFRDTHIDTIPSAVFAGERLRHVSLVGNRLSSLPEPPPHAKFMLDVQGATLTDTLKGTFQDWEKKELLVSVVRNEEELKAFHQQAWEQSEPYFVWAISR
jgi:hypothetical protein